MWICPSAGESDEQGDDGETSDGGGTGAVCGCGRGNGDVERGGGGCGSDRCGADGATSVEVSLFVMLSVSSRSPGEAALRVTVAAVLSDGRMWKEWNVREIR
jgi:hypothetical protein